MSDQLNNEREYFVNEQGGYGNRYGPAYAQRVQKSKRGEYAKAGGYVLLAIIAQAAGYSGFVLPMLAIAGITLVVGLALGGGHSEGLRWLLVLALLGGLGWLLLNAAPVLMVGLMGG